jgi:FAD/FMN-containing dehydrogenase
MGTRREFLRFLATTPIGAWACASGASERVARVPIGERVNDIHARLNETWVERVIVPQSTDEVQAAVVAARDAGQNLAIAGGRHAMGGQQFLRDGWLLDMRALSLVRDFDTDRGLLTVDAGMFWPDVFEFLETTWDSDGSGWGIVQKQTGADRLSIGGTLAANAHGRVLTRPPIVADVERFILVDGDGQVHTVSRQENRNLFRLAIGGYGLFGAITRVTLRLVPRRKVERFVREAMIEEVPDMMRERIADGHLYGDFQFGIDHASEAEFLRRGILSTYRPAPLARLIPSGQRRLAPRDWEELLVLAHTRPSEALKAYVGHYLKTNGQIYWADTQQLGYYRAGYHVELDQLLSAPAPATEVISELYVPPEELASFMAVAARRLRAIGVPVIYGTVRFIEPDIETFLPWASRRYACIVFNLHTEHTPEGLQRSGAAFRALIDEALARGGSFFLTYHRFATREQVETAYPLFPRFLGLKQVYDPAERFQSDWYRHYRELFA